MNYKFQGAGVAFGLAFLVLAFFIAKISFMAGLLVGAVAAIYSFKVIRDTWK